MAKRMMAGICNICGRNGDLSFEHIPPASALNNSKVLVASADAYWNRGPGQGQRATGKQYQSGFGENSLCEYCNHKTGQWYVSYFSRWCHEGMALYDHTKGKSALAHMSTIFPLPVLKQIVTMFLAQNGQYFRDIAKESLVRFVLNKDQRCLDPKIRFWVYLVAPGPLRKTPFCTVLNTVTGESVQVMEFSFPPFGYMMTIDSRPADNRLSEITHFSRFQYHEMAWMSMRLGLLPTHTPVLGDYRSFKNMDRVDGEPNVVLDFSDVLKNRPK